MGLIGFFFVVIHMRAPFFPFIHQNPPCYSLCFAIDIMKKRRNVTVCPTAVKAVMFLCKIKEEL